MSRGRVVIRCRAPENRASSVGPIRTNGVLPSFADVSVVVVDEKGQEHELHDVSAVKYFARASDNVPEAFITLLAPDVEIEGAVDADIPALVERLVEIAVRRHGEPDFLRELFQREIARVAAASVVEHIAAREATLDEAEVRCEACGLVVSREGAAFDEEDGVYICAPCGDHLPLEPGDVS